MFNTKQSLRVIPVHVIPSRGDKEKIIANGEELESLISTLQGNIVDRIIQKLDYPDNRTYIGKGKVQELARAAHENKADIIVLNAMVKPRQVHALKEALREMNPTIEVWDRIDLILTIFDKHAATMEAKLQIELARMNYMGPRIYGMGYVLSRQGGGIGTSGIGETNTELMKRHWRNEKKKITDQLERLSKNKEQQLERRKRAGFKTVSIVGYTNAGKSSLFNDLTGKDKLAKNVLFATLDSSAGKMYLQGLPHEILITDTIGFIRDLPPLLISAFKSTLLESVQADILLHVIDMSDPQMEEKIKVVNSILHELGRDTENIIYVFNKTDMALPTVKEKTAQTYSQYSPLFISAKTKEGIDDLKEILKQRLVHENDKPVSVA